jgi:hypothetical protein
MRNLDGVPYLLGIVQAADFIVPLHRDANNTVVTWTFLWICSLINTGLSLLSKCIPFSTISQMLGWRENK